MIGLKKLPDPTTSPVGAGPVGAGGMGAGAGRTPRRQTRECMRLPSRYSTWSCDLSGMAWTVVYTPSAIPPRWPVVLGSDTEGLMSSRLRCVVVVAVFCLASTQLPLAQDSTWHRSLSPAEVNSLVRSPTVFGLSTCASTHVRGGHSSTSPSFPTPPGSRGAGRTTSRRPARRRCCSRRPGGQWCWPPTSWGRRTSGWPSCGPQGRLQIRPPTGSSWRI